MDNLQRAIVSVSISGDNLVPLEITKLLGGPPRLSIAKGETFLASHGKQIEARTGMWTFADEWASPPHLDRQIGDLLSALSDDMATWADLSDRYKCYLSIGGYFNDWTGGLTLEANTLGLLAARKLAIDLDLYAPAASV